MAARLPVRSTNRIAASTFGPIEPAAKSCPQLGRGDPLQPLLLGRPPAGYTPSTSVAITNSSASTSRASSSLARSLSMTASTPASDRLAPGRTWSGYPLRRRRSHDVLVQQPTDRPDLEDALRSGDGTTRRHVSPSCLKTQPFSAASAVACSRRRRDRRTSSGHRRRGRPGRPRPWSAGSRTAPRR